VPIGARFTAPAFSTESPMEVELMCAYSADAAE